MQKKKQYKFVCSYIDSGMFVPFAILMMPLVKQTAEMHIDNIGGVIILYVVFYMPMNVLLYTGYLRNIPLALEEAAYVDGATTWQTYWKIVFPMICSHRNRSSEALSTGPYSKIKRDGDHGNGNFLPRIETDFQY